MWEGIIGTQFANWEMDEVAILNKALSAPEVETMYNNYFTNYIPLDKLVQEENPIDGPAIFLTLKAEDEFMLTAIGRCKDDNEIWKTGVLEGFSVETGPVVLGSEEIAGCPAPTVYPADSGNSIVVLGTKNQDGEDWVTLYVVSYNISPEGEILLILRRSLTFHL